MSEKFYKVKDYYDRGLWNIERVRNAVVKGWITAEEFELITGQPYTPPENIPGDESTDMLNALNMLGVTPDE